MHGGADGHAFAAAAAARAERRRRTRVASLAIGTRRSVASGPGSLAGTSVTVMPAPACRACSSDIALAIFCFFLPQGLNVCLPQLMSW